MPTADFPGIGASMRTLVAASASARSSASDGDARNLDAALGLELVTRDRRAALDVHDLRADAEARKRIFEHVRAVRLVDVLARRHVEDRQIGQPVPLVRRVRHLRDRGRSRRTRDHNRVGLVLVLVRVFVFFHVLFVLRLFDLVENGYEPARASTRRLRASAWEGAAGV